MKLLDNWLKSYLLPGTHYAEPYVRVALADYRWSGQGTIKAKGLLPSCSILISKTQHLSLLSQEFVNAIATWWAKCRPVG